MKREGFALALALLVSSSEAVLAQRSGRGGAAGNLAEELASCVRAVAPTLARNGMQMTVRLHENGSLTDAPDFRSAGSPLPTAQMRDAIGSLRRCFPLEGVQRYRYQYREWQTLVISFGDAAETAPSSSAGPRDISGAPHREPASSPDQASVSRVAHLRCEDLPRIDPLTVASWATLSRVPLLQLTYDELQELKLKARACSRRPNLDIPPLSALYRLESNFEGLSTKLKEREAEARVSEQRRREAEAADRLFEEATTELRGIVSAQSVRDPYEACDPTADEVFRRLLSRVGPQQSGRLSTIPLWRQFSRDCEARLGRAREAARNAEQSRKEAALASAKRRVFEHAKQSFENHRATIDRLGLPDEFLDAPLNLRPQATVSALMVDLDLSPITVGQWIGMIMSARPDATFAGVTDRESGLEGFSMKVPGSRTIAFFLKGDGGDVFVTRFQNGDMIYGVHNVADRLLVDAIVFGLTGLSDILSARISE